jgi:benzoate-CoA ligase
LHLHSHVVQTAELYGRAVLGLQENDVVFSAAKLFFAYGLGNALSFPLAVGATTVLLSARPTPSEVFGLLEKHQPTVFYGVPTLFASLLAQNQRPPAQKLNLRVCTSAGEALPAEIGKKWQQEYGVDILDGIGSTEMLHIFLSNRPGRVRYGTTGEVVPGYHVRVANLWPLLGHHVLEQPRENQAHLCWRMDPQRRQIQSGRRWFFHLWRAH